MLCQISRKLLKIPFLRKLMKLVVFNDRVQFQRPVIPTEINLCVKLKFSTSCFLFFTCLNVFFLFYKLHGTTKRVYSYVRKNINELIKFLGKKIFLPDIIHVRQQIFSASSRFEKIYYR